MAQVTIHLPVEPNAPRGVEERKRLVTEILGKYGLSLPGTALNAGAAEQFHNVAIPDQRTAQGLVAELQSKGITAFLKPTTYAP